MRAKCYVYELSLKVKYRVVALNNIRKKEKIFSMLIFPMSERFLAGDILKN